MKTDGWLLEALGLLLDAVLLIGLILFAYSNLTDFLLGLILAVRME